MNKKYITFILCSMFCYIQSNGQGTKTLSKNLIAENLLEYRDSIDKYSMAYKLNYKSSDNISFFLYKEDSLIKEIRIQSKGLDIGIINVNEKKLELLPNMKISDYYSCWFRNDTLYCKIIFKNQSHALITISKNNLCFRETYYNSKTLSQLQYYFDRSNFLRLEKKEINK